jgi:hypothetical protein
MSEKSWTDMWPEVEWFERLAQFVGNDKLPVGGNHSLHAWFNSMFGPESDECIERNLRSFMRRLRMDARFQFEGGPRNRTVAMISGQLDVEQAAQLQDTIVQFMLARAGEEGMNAAISQDDIDALAGQDEMLKSYALDQLIEHARVLKWDAEREHYVLGPKRLLGTGAGKTATSFKFPKRTLDRLREVTDAVNELRRELQEKEGLLPLEQMGTKAPLLELLAQGEGKITITELMEFALEFFSGAVEDFWAFR